MRKHRKEATRRGCEEGRWEGSAKHGRAGDQEVWEEVRRVCFGIDEARALAASTGYDDTNDKDRGRCLDELLRLHKWILEHRCVELILMLIQVYQILLSSAPKSLHD